MEDARRRFERDGFLVVHDALDSELLERVHAAHDRVYEEVRARGGLGEDGSLHLLGIMGRDRAFLELLDLESTFPLVCALLGWNIYVYHCHLDAHPPVRNRKPAWRWHQDGGRQNLEIESRPTRPRLSVKVAFFLTDVPTADHGAFMVLPGSHRRNTLPRPEPPELGFEEPKGSAPVLVRAGSAVVFDRRIWHARGENESEATRKALFLGYTYRWIRPRDPCAEPQLAAKGLSPVRRQLLGVATDGMGFWTPTEEDVPLRAWLLNAARSTAALRSHR